MRISIEAEGLDSVTRLMMHMPGIYSRARKSALSSVGWYVRGELRNHIEYGGANWPELHPLTRAFRHKYGTAGKWIKRSGGKRLTPLFWLGKFARYRVDRDGTQVTVDFGKSRRGQPGRLDPGLSRIALRHEKGEKVRVTARMRRFMGATRRKRPKRQIPGETYFPLRKTTQYLVIPRRPIFAPVWRKVNRRIPGLFKRKFWEALKRYQTEGSMRMAA